MATYEIGGQKFRRKNLYMPCVIGARFDDMTDEEKVAVYKATYWSDNITNAEWPVVLGDDEATASNRSRLKKKAAGWVMALARIAYLNPDLIADVLQQAREMYGDQIGEDLPWPRLAAGLAGLEIDDRPVEVEVELRTVRNDGETES